jgi:hypothetical protein
MNITVVTISASMETNKKKPLFPPLSGSVGAAPHKITASRSQS